MQQGGTTAIPFMMTSDRSVNFSSDTLVNESIKTVKDTLKQDNKEILDKIERVAVAFEKFGQDRLSRQRNRSGDTDNRRGSNDRYSRSPSRSPGRDGYSRRNYFPYRGNSGDRYNSRYDRRDNYRYRDRSRSPSEMDYNSRGYKSRSNSGSRYSGNRGQPPKNVGAFCSRTGHPIEYCWDFQKYLEKIGKQLSKIKDGQTSKKKSEEESSDKAFVM